MDTVPEADAARMLAKKQRRARRSAKLASYGTKAARRQYAIDHNLHRPPPRSQNVVATQHQMDQNNLARKIADAEAIYHKYPTEENHKHLMMYVGRLTHVVHQDDAHAPTHSVKEHVKRRSKKSKAVRERAEAHRQYFEDNPITVEQRMQKAAESKARREAAGGDEAYRLQKKERQKAEREARKFLPMRDVDLPDAEFDPGSGGYMTQFRGVPSAYEIG